MNASHLRAPRGISCTPPCRGSSRLSLSKPRDLLSRPVRLRALRFASTLMRSAARLRAILRAFRGRSRCTGGGGGITGTGGGGSAREGAGGAGGGIEAGRSLWSQAGGAGTAPAVAWLPLLSARGRSCCTGVVPRLRLRSLLTRMCCWAHCCCCCNSCCRKGCGGVGGALPAKAWPASAGRSLPSIPLEVFFRCLLKSSSAAISASFWFISF